MKEPLKVGDRVAVYGALSTTHRYVGTVEDVSMDKVRILFDETDMSDNTQREWAHEKACRRLKPKRKAREWWFHLSDLPKLNEVFFSSAPTTNQPQNWVCVREVLPKAGL